MVFEDIKIKLEEYYDYIVDTNNMLSDALHGINSLIKERMRK